MAAHAVSAARAVTPRAAPARRASAARAPSPRLAVRTAVASPSMPTPPALPVPDFLKGPLEEITKQIDANLPEDAKRQVLRAQYTSAIGLRLAFFLTQGVLSSRVSGSSNIDGAAAASAIAKAVLDPNPRAKIPDAESNLGNIVRNAADGRELSEDEAAEVSQFLSQHLTSIVNLFRQELEHLENGVYKFPYDLNPTTAPRSSGTPRTSSPSRATLCGTRSPCRTAETPSAGRSSSTSSPRIRSGIPRTTSRTSTTRRTVGSPRTARACTISRWRRCSWAARTPCVVRCCRTCPSGCAAATRGRRKFWTSRREPVASLRFFAITGRNSTAPRWNSRRIISRRCARRTNGSRTGRSTPRRGIFDSPRRTARRCLSRMALSTR